MRALRTTPAGVRLDPRTPAPAPEPGEALVRVTRAMISRGEARAAATPAGTPPFTLGREFVGVVEKITPASGASGIAGGPELRRLQGKRIVASASVVCGQCDLCRHGLSTHCRNRIMLGTPPPTGRDGCFADLVRIPTANLYQVPDSVDDDRAVWAWTLSQAAHAARHVRFETRPYVSVLGDGALGLLCAQTLARLNASVRLLGRHETRMELCAKWGVKHRPADEVGHREDQDVVVDCTGSPSGLEFALKLVRPRGTVILMGDQSPGQIDLGPVVENEIEIVGCRGGSIPDALRMLEREQADVPSLVSRRFKLDSGVEAIQAAARPESLRVLLDI